jgi:hypothetical protein
MTRLAHRPTRRGAIIALAGFAATLVGCKTEQTPAVATQAPGTAAASPAAAKPSDAKLQAGVKIATIVVDPSRVLTQSGEVTAGWVESALPGELARAFAPFMAPGDPSGATLTVAISEIVLGGVGGATGAIDTIGGEATLNGGGAASKTADFTVTTAYVGSAADPYQKERAHEVRVMALLSAFARGLPAKLEP